MAQLLAHPLRLTPAGSLTTVEAGSDANHAQDLAVTIGTRRGERAAAVEFGVTDPTFAAVDIAELTAVVDTYGPPVIITGVTTSYDTGGTTATTVVTFT